jgi:hypothetical protein
MQRAALHTPELVTLANEAHEALAAVPDVLACDDEAALKEGAATALEERRRVEAVRDALIREIHQWANPSIVAYSKLAGACEQRLHVLEYGYDDSGD